MTTTFKVREKEKHSGEWWVYGYHEGLRSARKIGKSFAAAERTAERLAKRVKAGDISFFEKDVPTFRTLANQTLDIKDPDVKNKGDRSNKVRRSSMERYRSVLKSHILPTIGKMPITKIDQHHIGAMLTKAIDDGVSASTMTIIRSLLVDTCSRAYMTIKEVEVNVAREVINNGVTVKSKRNKYKGKPLSEHQLPIFLETTMVVAPEYYAMFATILNTGMRLGECLALKWKDIDFDKQLISITKAFRRELTKPKSKAGCRNVEFPLSLIPILKAHRRHGERIMSMDDLVFGRDGTYERQNQCRRVFKRILKHTSNDSDPHRQIGDRRLHDLRHTYGSIMAAKGVPLHWLKNQLGHSSINITSDIYGQKQVSDDRSTVDAFGTLSLQPGATCAK